jgi:hypothetical protein
VCHVPKSPLYLEHEPEHEIVEDHLRCRRAEERLPLGNSTDAAQQVHASVCLEQILLAEVVPARSSA